MISVVLFDKGVVFYYLTHYIILLCSNGNANAQEQNGRASVEPVDAARVSSWLGGTGEAPSNAAKHPPTMESFAEFQKFERERHFTYTRIHRELVCE
jgi:hypothetical protein